MDKYRPFESCKELIERWRRIWREARRFYDEYDYNLKVEMPAIWVMNKFTSIREMIVGYGADIVILPGEKKLIMQELLEDYTFLDGSPCGVLDQEA